MVSLNFVALGSKLLILWVFEFLVVGRVTYVEESASFSGKISKFCKLNLDIDRKRSIEDPPANPR